VGRGMRLENSVKVIEINSETGTIVDGEQVKLQQNTWNGKDTVSVYLTKDEIFALIEKLK